MRFFFCKQKTRSPQCPPVSAESAWKVTPNRITAQDLLPQPPLDLPSTTIHQSRQRTATNKNNKPITSTQQPCSLGADCSRPTQPWARELHIEEHHRPREHVAVKAVEETAMARKQLWKGDGSKSAGQGSLQARAIGEAANTGGG